MEHFLTPEDICAHGGEDYSQNFGAMSPPIYQTSLFTRHEGMETRYVYTRVDNPTIHLAETKIAMLEHGERALCVGSGMAAISTAILACVRAGDHIVMVRNAYGPARTFADYLGEKFNIATTFVTGERVEEFEAVLRPNTSLIYLESPSSYVMSLQDIRAVAELAKARGIKTIIDNTCATPLYQNPLTLGVDLVVHSATKYFGGHSDIVAGVIAGGEELISSISKQERQLLGGIMDPHQAWLLIRGLRTLPLRVAQHSRSAMEVADFLENHPKVARVLYPALPSHPQHDLYLKQMTGCSGLLSFVSRGSREENNEFLRRIQVFQKGPSWGGYDSLISPIGVNMEPEQSEQTGIPMGLIRLAIGLENVDTLKQALDDALKAIG